MLNLIGLWGASAFKKIHLCVFECQDRCYLYSTAPFQHESLISEPSDSRWSNNHLLCSKQHNIISVAPLLLCIPEWNRSKAALSELLGLLCFRNPQEGERNPLRCIIMFNDHLKKYSHILIDLVWWMFWTWMNNNTEFLWMKARFWNLESMTTLHYLHFYVYCCGKTHNQSINQSNIIQLWEDATHLINKAKLYYNINVAGGHPLHLLCFMYNLLPSESSWRSMSRQNDSFHLFLRTYSTLISYWCKLKAL